MGVYVSVRGWLECDEKQSSTIQTIISARNDEHYSNGWGTPRRRVNWNHYVFFGADIRESAVDWFLGQLREIAAIPASDDDGDRVTGLFLVSHEVDGMSEWQVRQGQVFITPSDDRYGYLDA